MIFDLRGRMARTCRIFRNSTIKDYLSKDNQQLNHTWKYFKIKIHNEKAASFLTYNFCVIEMLLFVLFS